jgi:hypothetical protein
MSFEGLVQIKKAIGMLSPKEVRELSQREVRIALHASDMFAFEQMENFLLTELHPIRRRESADLLMRNPPSPNQADVNIYHASMQVPAKSLIYQPDQPDIVVAKTLNAYPDLGIALARSFQPFRGPYVKGVITDVCKENTLFALATAIPDIVPFISLPWALAEFASDSAFLTMNQIRMGFMIAGASDREVGYLEQKGEIAAVIGTAFGWRALARELVGKIPFGGGLIAKAAVAYAGTKVLGISLDHYYNLGYNYSREERNNLYAEAFQQGKSIAAKLLHTIRPDLAAKLADTEQAGQSASSSSR